jgi:hypothetical protein
MEKVISVSRVNELSRVIVAASLFGILISSVASAQQTPAAPAPAANPSDPPIPRYDFHRTPSAIVIDRKLDDPAWAAASAPATLQFLWDAQTGAGTFRRASGSCISSISLRSAAWARSGVPPLTGRDVKRLGCHPLIHARRFG